jgi:LuxR family quorum sensing-dependent transcriptional regulator
MRTEIERLFDFIKSADQHTRLDDLTVAAAVALEPFGVTSLSANLIYAPRQVARPGILFGRRWKDWSEDYRRFQYYRSDPAVRMLQDEHLPFTWDEALARYPSPAAYRVMDACAAMTGSREGLVVPVRESDGTLLTTAMAGQRLDLSPESKPAMHLAGIYYATRGRELVQGITILPDCPLTERQIACLQLVHAGKTDREIGLLLGISMATAHNHVEAAKGVMGCAKRSTTAFEAWRRGWLF